MIGRCFENFMLFPLDLKNRLFFGLYSIVAVDAKLILFEKFFDFDLNFTFLFECNFIFDQCDFINNCANLFVFAFSSHLNVGCAYCTHFKYWNYDFGLVHGGLEFLLFFKIRLGFALDFQQYSEWQQPVGAVSLTKVKIFL
jgi:hypothetical protein